MPQFGKSPSLSARSVNLPPFSTVSCSEGLPSLPSVEQMGTLEDASLLMQNTVPSGVSFNPFSLLASMARGGSSGNLQSALYTPIPPPDMVGVDGSFSGLANQSIESQNSQNASWQTTPTLPPSLSDTKGTNAINPQQHQGAGRLPEPLSFGPDGPTLTLQAVVGIAKPKTYRSILQLATEFKSRVLQAVPESHKLDKSWLESAVGKLLHNGERLSFERACAEVFAKLCSDISIRFTYTVFYYLMDERTDRNAKPTAELVKSPDRGRSNKLESFTFLLVVQTFLNPKSSFISQYTQDDGDKLLTKDVLERSLNVSLYNRTYDYIQATLYKAYKAKKTAILDALQREAGKYQARIWVAPGGIEFKGRLTLKDPDNHAPIEVVDGGQFGGADEGGDGESVAE